MQRQIPARDSAALKAASSALIDKVGGVAQAAQLTQSTPSRISEAQSPFHDNRWLSLIHVADLECVAGEPLVSRVMADLCGYTLVPQTPGRPQDMHQHLAHILVETSDVTSALSVAMTDGRVDGREAQRLKLEAQGAIDALQAFMAECDRIAGRSVRMVRP